jgi:hypothetical protein
VLVRTEAWVYPKELPGTTVPLLQFWHAGRRDNLVTATREGIDSAVAAGYELIRDRRCRWPGVP